MSRYTSGLNSDAYHYFIFDNATGKSLSVDQVLKLLNKDQALFQPKIGQEVSCIDYNIMAVGMVVDINKEERQYLVRFRNGREVWKKYVQPAENMLL